MKAFIHFSFIKLKAILRSSTVTLLSPSLFLFDCIYSDDKIYDILQPMPFISEIISAFLCDLPVGHDPHGCVNSISHIFPRTMQIAANSIILH